MRAIANSSDLQSVALDAIRLDGGTQSRAGIDDAVVEDYAFYKRLEWIVRDWIATNVEVTKDMTAEFLTRIAAILRAEEESR